MLAGRYRLEDRVRANPDGAIWRAVDETLERQVSIRVISPEHPYGPEIGEAARRAALIDDARLIRVLDVGVELDTIYVVTEFVDGDTLTHLVRRRPLPADLLRRVIGEAAEALDRAAARGLHHLRLGPDSLVILPDGTIRVLGLATDAAAVGLDPDNPGTAVRADTVGLVALLYAGLTGRWPLDQSSSLDAAPRHDGRPVPVDTLSPGCPPELAALCSATLAAGGGPYSPGELARELGPWEPAQPLEVPRSVPTRPSPSAWAFPPEVMPLDRPLDPSRGPAPGRSHAPAAHASDQERAGRPVAPAVAVQPSPPMPIGPATVPTSHLVGNEETGTGLPTLLPFDPEPNGGSRGPVGAPPPPPAAAPPPAPLPSPPVPQAAPPPPPAPAPPGVMPAGQAEATRASSRAGSGGRRGQHLAGRDAGESPTVRPPVGVERPPGGVAVTPPAPPAAVPFWMTPVEDRQGFAAPAGAPPARPDYPPNGARGVPPEPAVPTWAAGWPVSGTTAETPAIGPFPLAPPQEPPTRGQSRMVIFVTAGLLLLGLIIAVYSLRDLTSPGKLFGPADRFTPPTSTAAAKPTGSATSPGSASAGQGVQARIVNVTPIDPLGDGSEDPARVGRAFDGDLGTFWRSDTYRTEEFGGLKSGLGLVVDLGRTSSVPSVTVRVHGSGGHLQLRVGTSADSSGGAALAESDTTDGPVTLTPPAGTTARYLVIWCDRLPAVNGEFRLEIAEITVP